MRWGGRSRRSARGRRRRSPKTERSIGFRRPHRARRSVGVDLVGERPRGQLILPRSDHLRRRLPAARIGEGSRGLLLIVGKSPRPCPLRRGGVFFFVVLPALPLGPGLERRVHGHRGVREHPRADRRDARRLGLRRPLRG